MVLEYGDLLGLAVGQLQLDIAAAVVSRRVLGGGDIHREPAAVATYMVDADPFGLVGHRPTFVGA